VPDSAAAAAATAAVAAIKALLEFLSSAGPIGNFFFGFSTSQLWSMIEGMQLIVMYPMLGVDAPGNLGLLQAVMRKISTFELIDGDILKENLWEFDLEEEEPSYYLLSAGLDSAFFQFTFGLPLYILAYTMALALVLPIINGFRNIKCSEPPAELEGGDPETETTESKAEVDERPDESCEQKSCRCTKWFCGKFCDTQGT